MYVEKFNIIEDLLNNNIKYCNNKNNNISTICNTFNPTLHTARAELTKKHNSLLSLQKSYRLRRD